MKKALLRYLTFALSTVAGTIVDTLVLFICAHWLFSTYIGKTIISPTISFEFAVLTNYTLAYFFVWEDRITERSRGDFWRRFVIYNMSCVAGFLVKMVILLIAQLITHFDVVWCNLIALCFSGILNFALNEFLVFAHKDENGQTNILASTLEKYMKGFKSQDLKFKKAGTIQTILLCLFCTVPCFYRVFLNGSDNVGYLLLTILSAAPIVFFMQSIRRRWIFVILMSVLLISSFVETFLIVVYQDFIRTGNLLSAATTTKRESGNFFANNVGILLYEIPVIVLYIATIWHRFRIQIRPPRVNVVRTVIAIAACIFLSVCGHRVLSNPPFNIYVETGNAVLQQIQKRINLPQGENMTFNATRPKVEGREIYIMGVGESLRYDHTSLGGYERKTTPLLDARTNLISFDDYYSNATLTFYSVPMMLSRATSKDYNLHYREKSIVEPFKKCGFKTFVISCKKLLANEPYITRGVDSIFSVSADREIAGVIDSLSHIYPKTFFVIQMLQCHSYYNNFTPEFDVYHPNLVSDPDVKSPDLYLNAYDNTVLYTDYIISGILDTINQPDVQSAFLFASDHGEILTMKGSRRGNSLTPSRAEYHVPLLFWYSDKWAAHHAKQLANAKSRKATPLNANNLFYSACEMADITLPERYAKTKWSIFSDDFQTHTRYLLLPDGRSRLNQDKAKK